MIGGAEHSDAILQEAARRRLQDERLEITAPKARIDQRRILLQQGRDLGAVLTRAEFRPELDFCLRFRLGLGEAALEILPRILAPGVIWVDGADIGHVDTAPYKVAGHGDVIHRAVGRRAKDVFELVLLEDARRTAVKENEKPLQFLGRRRDSESIARTNIAQQRVDVVALERIAQFFDLLGGAAGLVNELNFDLQATESDLVVGLG